MESLQKFKLFAAQCGLEAATTSGNPTLSPTQSPVFHLRRRKTLRMLLNRTSDDRRSDLRHILDESPESDRKSAKNKKENRGRRKLKELFVSSPSPPFEDREKRGGDGELDERRETLPVTGSSTGGGREFVSRRIGSSASLRPFRKRILRKPWRPVLVSVPEQ